MGRRRLAASLIAALCVAAAAAAPAAAAEPPASGPARGPLPPLDSGGASPKVRTLQPQATPGANGYVAFGRAAGGAYPIDTWRMLDGGDQVPIATNGVGRGDKEPAWSPGGTLVAFSRDRTSSIDDNGDDIYLMKLDGSGVQRLTTSTAGDSTPDWFPDGSRLVFTSIRSGGYEVYSMRIDGSDVKRLTTTAGFNGDPTVSPDGTRIAFSSSRSGDYEIYTMKVDGSDVQRLTSVTGDDYAPDWSPDGSKIAFTSLRTGNAEIFTMNADGSNEVNRSNDPSYHDQHPAWSPDGVSLIFDGFTTDLDLDLWTMPWAGGIATIVGSTTDAELDPDWQPIPDFPLVDAKFSTFEHDIEWVFEQGITVGCSPERYCPNDPVTRAQMATFLVRALDLPSTATDYFTDDETSSHEADINRLAAAAITSGCAQTLYCPTNNVTRGEMASFLARAFDLPATATDYFDDDDGTTHEANINKVAAAGITSGCGQNLYCPTANVTRGQMAAFLRRALE